MVYYSYPEPTATAYPQPPYAYGYGQPTPTGRSIRYTVHIDSHEPPGADALGKANAGFAAPNPPPPNADVELGAKRLPPAAAEL